MANELKTAAAGLPSVKDRVKNAKLYCVTMPPDPGRTYSELVESACKGGADVVQFREKRAAARDVVILGLELSALCREYGVLFIVNDRLDAALACGADGVHLGQEDLSVMHARKIVNSCGRNADFIIGCSTHSVEQAIRAEMDGADYVGCGPVFATPTKPDYVPVGLGMVSEYRKKVKIPFVAIGGIDSSNIQSVMNAGAGCAAVVRAVFGSGDAERSARLLKSMLNGK